MLNTDYKQKYDKLAAAVKDLFSAEDAYKKSGNNQRYLPDVWAKKAVVKKIIESQNKASQATMEWLER